MGIAVNKISDRYVVSLNEVFDASCIEDFRSCYESLADLENHTIEIDFERTHFIDSSALGMLINARGYFAPQGVKLVLINPGPQIRKILDISRFDKKFEIR